MQSAEDRILGQDLQSVETPGCEGDPHGCLQGGLVHPEATAKDNGALDVQLLGAFCRQGGEIGACLEDHVQGRCVPRGRALKDDR